MQLLHEALDLLRRVVGMQRGARAVQQLTERQELELRARGARVEALDKLGRVLAPCDIFPDFAAAHLLFATARAKVEAAALGLG